MKKEFILLAILICFLVLGSVLVSCNNGTTDGSSNNGRMDGTWNNLPMTLIISGNNYTSKFWGVNYGKGTISYNGSTFTLTSTHAWTGSSWYPFTETVSGNYSLSGNTMTISGVEGRYQYFNGYWNKS